MLKVRDLTESLEKKYNLDEGGPTLDELPFDEIMNQEETDGNMGWYEEDHPDWKRYQKEVDEAYEYELDDELDAIMNDDTLSDDEKEQAISDLYSKYKLEGYNISNSLTEAYRFKVIPEDPDSWGCSTEEEFQNILNLEDEEIVEIIKATDGAPYYDITFANGEQLYGVAQNCIYTSTNESLKEDYWNPTPWFNDLVNNYETWTGPEWNSWDQERRDAEVTKAIKLFLMDNPLSEDEVKEFIYDLKDNNFHTEARILAKLCNL